MKNIALVLNSKFVNQSLVFLESLFINNKDSEFSVYVINSSLNEEEITKLENECKKYNNKLINIKVDEKLFDNAPILWKTHSKEAYYKLLLPEVLPKEVKKILYFDVDIIINGNIDDLYNINLEDNYIAAAPDYFVNKYKKDYVVSLGIKQNEYFNSGVVLFNIEEIRKKYSFKDAEKYIADNGKNFHYHDQEVLNALWKNKLTLIDEKYNYIAKYRGLMDFFNYKFRENKNVIVVHYAGIKPWNPLYYGKYYDIFWNYAKIIRELNYIEHKKIRSKNIAIVFLKTIKNIIKVK